MFVQLALWTSEPAISSAAVSPARTFPPLANGPGSPERAPASGTSSCGSPENFDPGPSSSKTSRAASAPGCPSCGTTSCHLGTSQRPGALELRMWALHTGGSERSSSEPWATPARMDGARGAGRGTSGRAADNLKTQAVYPTPTVKITGTNRGGAEGRVGPVRPLLGTLLKGLSSEWVEALMGFPPGWTSLPDGLPRAVKRKKRGSPAAPVPLAPSPATQPGSAPSGTPSSRRSLR